MEIQKETGRKVINLDARSHGNSPRRASLHYFEMVNDAIKVFRKLEIPKVSIIGHSMGGYTCMALSLLCPDLVSSLIVVDISPVKARLDLVFAMNVLKCMDTVPLKSSLTMSEARQLADHKLQAITTDKKLRIYLVSNLVRTATGEYTWKTNIPALRDNLINNIAKFPPSLKGRKYLGPTLFICGASSEHVLKEDLPEIKDFFPQAEFTFIEGAKHWVQTDQPERFRETVCKFLNEK
ncbi:protein ABHD11-like isoform X2 [Leptidea sinapis]|nr:protein ABHD11-like isoform X2 [Leptidea sinapis]